MTPWAAGLILECGQIVCYILLITVDHVIARYVFVCLATAATSSFFPILWPGELSRVWFFLSGSLKAICTIQVKLVHCI